MTDTYRAAVYNLLNGGVDDDRLPQQVGILYGLRPDILCLPEATFWADNDEARLWWVADQLDMAVAYMARSYIGDGRNHTALLYRPSRFRLVGRRLIDPNRFTHAMIKARLRPVEANDDSQDVLTLATHLDPFDGTKRLSEARRVTDFGGTFPGAPDRAILLGDLNVSDREPETWDDVPRNLHSRYRLVLDDGTFGGVDRRALDALLGSGWTDPQTLTGVRRTPTVGYYYPNEPVPWCLDYVLTRGLAVETYQTLDTPQARKLSDHLPIWADFSLTSPA